jgi:hypothetical protein
MKEQPHKAAIGNRLDLTFDRIVSARFVGRRKRTNESKSGQCRDRLSYADARTRARAFAHEQPLKPEWQKRHDPFRPAKMPATTA